MLALPLLASVAVATALPQPLPEYGGQSIEWQACPELFPDPSPLDCGFLDVPMDWNRPHDSEKITVGVTKLAAKRPEQRIGNIFFNPGGPGLQPSSDLYGIDAVLHPEIRNRFDFIGVDLRGTGISSPINCSIPAFTDVVTQPMYPETEESFDRLLDANQAFRQSCIDRSGDIVNYMDTVSIAKDHEAVRKAIGDEKLTWLGQSYGTQLGSQYAELFPDNIRAMVLDASYSLSQSVTALFVEGAIQNEATLRYFFDWCDSQNATVCPAAHRGQTMEQVWTDFLKRATESPLPCEEEVCKEKNVTEITSTLIRIAALGYLYTPEISFPQLALAIDQAALQGNVTLFVPSIYSEDDPLYSQSRTFANIIIAALDWSGVTQSSPADMRLKALLAESQTPLLNGTSAAWTYFLHRSLGWPLSLRNPPHRISIPEDSAMPKILMVSNLYDPATPVAMSHQLHEEIGWNRSVLTQTNRAGHTIYLNAAAQEGETVAAINAYLLDLELPEQGAVFET